MGAVLDHLPPGPLRVLHVGGAACTMARYVAATRPGSAQRVLEPDVALTARVSRRLPLPPGADISVDAVDGRAALTAGDEASADVVIVDAWAEGRVPADLTTAEAFAAAWRVLAGDGILLVNIADGRGSDYSRRVLATVGVAGAEVLAIGVTASVYGRGFGNLVVAARRGSFDVAALRTAAAMAAPGQTVLHGERLVEHVGDAAPLTDADPQASPSLPRSTFL